MYEIMNSRKDQEIAYTTNECYQLQTCQRKNTATSVEVEHSMKGDSQKGMKRCLIALVYHLHVQCTKKQQ